MHFSAGLSLSFSVWRARFFLLLPFLDFFDALLPISHLQH